MSILEYKNIKPIYCYSISLDHFNHFGKVISYINNSQHEHIKHKAKNKLIGYLSNKLKNSSEVIVNRVVNTINLSVSEKKGSY